MRLSITSRPIGEVHVLDLQGDLVAGPETEALTNQIRGLDDGQPRDILINLKGLSFIDSCGIGELIQNHGRCQRRNSRLKLACPSGMVEKVMRLTKLRTVIEIYDSEAEAAASFEESRE